jgi:hypothetical protein
MQLAARIGEIRILQRLDSLGTPPVTLSDKHQFTFSSSLNRGNRNVFCNSFLRVLTAAEGSPAL